MLLKKTDKVLQAIFDYAEKNLNLQAAIYSSDHGEDMVYSHGAAKFTFDMVRIPVFIYLSPEFSQLYPNKNRYIKEHEQSVFTNDLLFDTICGLFAAANSQYNDRFDLFNENYKLPADMAVTKHGKYLISDDAKIGKIR